MTTLRSRGMRRWAVAGATGAGLLLAGGGVAGATGAGWGPGMGHFGGGAFGTVSSLGSDTLQLQNDRSGQTTVNWTSSTTFRQVAKVDSSAVSVGDCVAVQGTQSNGTLSARSVTITPGPSNGSCMPTPRQGQLGPRNGGTPPAGVPFRHPGSDNDNDAPGANPPATPPGDMPDRGFAVGKVTATTPTTLTVNGFSSSSLPKPSSGSNGSTTPPTPPTATTVEVQLTDGTTYTKIASAAASNLSVGACVAAIGSRGSDGTVTATDITITATGGSCAPRFGAMGPGHRGSAVHAV